jgi:hypothetical protein
MPRKARSTARHGSPAGEYSRGIPRYHLIPVVRVDRLLDSGIPGSPPLGRCWLLLCCPFVQPGSASTPLRYSPGQCKWCAAWIAATGEHDTLQHFVAQQGRLSERTSALQLVLEGPV